MTTQGLTNRVERGSRFIDLNSVAWTEAEPGVYMKTIYKDDASGESKILMKLDTGTRSAMHSHDQIEEILVLEGSFYDHDGICRAGQFVWRQPGSLHETHSDEGCLLLAVYRKPNTFFNATAGFEDKAY